MSGTELSRVRTEFRLRPLERINQSLLESRGRHCYAIMWFWPKSTCPVSVYQAQARRDSRVTPALHASSAPRSARATMQMDYTSALGIILCHNKK
jgi:hypothetical protein